MKGYYYQLIIGVQKMTFLIKAITWLAILGIVGAIGYATAGIGGAIVGVIIAQVIMGSKGWP
jgi:hypothetical protein